MTLSTQQTRFLRGEAHKLKPVVMVGANGLTDNVIEEIDRSLDTHELIKVKIRAEEREAKQAMVETICSRTKSHKVQLMGHNLTLYRRSEKPKILLPRK